MWMLLHGFTGLPESWDAVLKHAKPDREPLRPVLAGHGARDAAHETSGFEDEVERIAILASAMERPRLIGGYSLGARLALGMLARDPSMFDGAVLVGVHPGLRDDAARRQRAALDASRARLLRSEGLAAFLDSWEALPLFETQRALPSDVRERQRRIRLAHDPEGLARSLDTLGLGRMPSCWSAFDTTAARVTLMAGARDEKFSQLASDVACRHPALQLCLVEGAGHNLLLEAPRSVAQAMRDRERRLAERAL